MIFDDDQIGGSLDGGTPIESSIDKRIFHFEPSIDGGTLIYGNPRKILEHERNGTFF